MGLIRDLVPNNLADEREKFFTSGATYNPQFRYNREFTVEELTKWGNPNPQLAERAAELVIFHLQHEPPRSTKMPPALVNLTYIKERIESFNQRLHLTEPLELRFTFNQIARCLISDHTASFKIPLVYSVAIFEDLFRHELESHFLRRHNHELQPYAAHTTPEIELRRTEEGLAGLHTYLERPDKFMRKSFLNYLSITWSQTLSFAEVYHKLKELGMADHKAWLATLRAKRGQTDTSQPGAITKDMCYLEGAIQVWSWLNQPNHDPHHLYIGRLALNEIETYLPQADLTKVVYPTFYDNLEYYHETIAEIGRVNHFAELAKYVK